MGRDSNHHWFERWRGRANAGAVGPNPVGRMPTVLRLGPFRFFFYAGDGSEPPHAHVERDDCEAKYWLDPVRLERSRGFRARDIRRLRELVEEHREELLEGWNAFFGG